MWSFGLQCSEEGAEFQPHALLHIPKVGLGVFVFVFVFVFTKPHALLHIPGVTNHKSTLFYVYIPKNLCIHS